MPASHASSVHNGAGSKAPASSLSQAFTVRAHALSSSELQLRVEPTRRASAGNGINPVPATWAKVGQPRPAQTALLPRPVHLTAREIQVLKLIAMGCTNTSIAQTISRSIKTVEKHRQSLNNKLRVHDTASLTRYAISAGLLSKAAKGVARSSSVHLTHRETQVLRLVAEGLPNKAIAHVLQRSINTVENHRERMMRKLRLHEIASVTRYAVSIGLVPDGRYACGARPTSPVKYTTPLSDTLEFRSEAGFFLSP